MTSSCTSAAAWNTSSAAAAVTTGSRSRGRQVRDASSTARHPATQKRPRSRLPPVDRGGRGVDEKRRLGAEIGGQSPLSRDKHVQTLGNRFDRVCGSLTRA